MRKFEFTGELQELIDRAEVGKESDVDYIINRLTNNATLAMTRYIDFALSLVESKQGVNRLEYYLFNGSLIQRNYSCLFFNRRGDYKIVDSAYRKGLIDEVQAFSR